MKKTIGTVLILLGLSGGLLRAAEKTIRVGYFPNITHAQALIGMADGRFQKALGDVRVEPKLFNAGPSAVEALFAGAIDFTYIGPGPAINAYVKSRGAYRIIAGAATGGAALVVRQGAGIGVPADFDGKRLATPQLGNTQDLAARAWLRRSGRKAREKGGTVMVMPVSNPDQLTLFQKKQLDAAWTIEPWVSRLTQEGGGRVLLFESELWKEITGGDYSTAVILASESFLKEKPDLLRKWLEMHREITGWIRAHPDAARKAVNDAIRQATGKALPDRVMDAAFPNVQFTVDPVKASVLQQGQWAFEEGFLGRAQPDFSKLFDLTLLNGVLQARGQKHIP